MINIIYFLIENWLLISASLIWLAILIWLLRNDRPDFDIHSDCPDYAAAHERVNENPDVLITGFVTKNTINGGRIVNFKSDK